MATVISDNAKEVAVYFYNKIGVKATPAMYAKTIKQAKTLLTAGYSVYDICRVIDYTVDIKKFDIYSLGYFSSTIAYLLKELDKLETTNVAKEVKTKMLNHTREVKDNNESAERNKQKAKNIGSQSRFGEKFTFDMHSKT